MRAAFAHAARHESMNGGASRVHSTHRTSGTKSLRSDNGDVIAAKVWSCLAAKEGMPRFID